MNTKSEIPVWNLSNIFPSLDSPEYKNAVKNFKNSMEKTKALLQMPFTDFSGWLKEYLQTSEELSSLSKTLNAYAYLIYSVDTTNTDFLNNISEIDNLLLQEDQLLLEFNSILKANINALPQFFKEFPDFKDYEYLLNEQILQTEHEMPKELEQLAGELQQTGGDAWDRLHEQIISNLKDSKTGKTFNELRNDAYSPNPAIRYESYKTEIELLRQNEIAMAASLNNLKGETITLNKRRNYPQAIERSLSASRMSRKTLDSLIGAIQKSLPQWRRYFKAKALYLKNHNQTASKATEAGLSFFDLFAPLSNSETNNSESMLSKNWSFQEAIEYVIQKYDSFSKEMGDFARKVRDEQWVDAKVRPGKVGGAYDEDIPLGHQSRIMTNFTGAFSDIITLAHEMGHAYHFSCMKGQPADFFDYPMTLAETASTFAETIVKQDLISKSKGFEKLQAIELDLQDVSQVLVDILCRFYFEKAVFEERAGSELNAQDFCRLMKDAQNKTYGDGLNSDLHEYMWAVKSHYYSTGLDFYNFPYAFGQLFAIALYLKYKKKEGAAFAEKYHQILSKTGNLSCEDLCASAGFNIETEEFWSEAISFYISEIDEFEELAK